MYEKELKVALKAAEEANKLLRQGFREAEKEVKDKKTGHVADYVTKFDYAVQKAILDIITKHFPSHSLLSEEDRPVPNNSTYQWIIDPLDGTTNFSRGIPNFATSIALAHKKEVVLGVIALPYEKEIYWATKKNPTRLNGKRVRVSRAQKLRSALVGISMLRSVEAMQLGTKTFAKLMKASIKPRVFGAVAADLARLSSGKLDAIVFNHNKPWDIAAGMFLVKQAGGKVSSLKGKELLQAEQLVASNAKLHPQILRLLRQ